MRAHSKNAAKGSVAGAAMACLAAVLLISALSAKAQAPPAVVKAKLLLATDAAHPGGLAEAAVVAQITPGYHINDHHPSLDYLIPTDLKLDSGKTLSVEKIVYPRGTPEKFIFSKSGLSVYEGQIAIGVRLKVARDVRPGEYPLQGKLEYQACNDHACLPPASVPLALTVKVAGPNVPLRRINSNVFRKIGPE